VLETFETRYTAAHSIFHGNNTMTTPVGWVDNWSALNTQPSAKLKTWMEYRESITDLAKEHFQQVNVELIGQGWQPPFVDEAHSVNQVATEQAIIREIFMNCDGDRCWYARTVIPTKTYEHFRSSFDELGTTPIGALLHKQEGVTRSPFQYTRLMPNTPLHSSLVRASPELATEALWARRSVFNLQGYPLLLQEIFLPVFTTCLPR
jgi:chorismate lyase